VRQRGQDALHPCVVPQVDPERHPREAVALAANDAEHPRREGAHLSQAPDVAREGEQLLDGVLDVGDEAAALRVAPQ
jgi:hypothetical protein